LLGGMFIYAVRRDYLKGNPCRNVLLYKDRKGDRFLTTEEFRRLGETLTLAETDGLPWVFNEGKKVKHRPVRPENQREVFSPHVTAAVRLLMFTGCRLREILHLRWQDIDFERGVLNLPDSKTGQKKVLLAGSALAILSDLPRSGIYVIAGNDPEKPRADLHRPWTRIIKYAELEGLRLHDLRHSYASIGAASGIGLPALGKLLGHNNPSTTQRYAHLADDPLRRASEEIANTIAAAIGNVAPPQQPQNQSSSASPDTRQNPSPTVYPIVGEQPRHSSIRRTGMKYIYLNRKQAAHYVTETWGVPCSYKWLAKLMVVGGSLRAVKFGRSVRYRADWLDVWVLNRMSDPFSSSSERQSRMRAFSYLNSGQGLPFEEV
jgi:site-specific recombinase XerD